MKRYFNICVITLVLFAFTGCVENNRKITTQTKTSDTEYICIEDSSNPISNIEIIIDNFEYEGHEYIWFRRGLGECTSGAAIHNPNCKYCKE